MFNRATLIAEAAAFAERGRAGSAAHYVVWSEAHPFKSCAHCFGAGSYAERVAFCIHHGTHHCTHCSSRRPFDHRDFDLSVERYVGTCPVCRGLGRVPTTREEARREEERNLLEQRRVYLAVRDAVCCERGIKGAEFNRLVKKRLRDDVPTAWVEAARAVASDFGLVFPLKCGDV